MRMKSKGFTLVELLVMLAIITLAIMTVYNIYNKKKNATLVQNQTVYLKNLHAGINSSFSSTSDFTLLNTSNVVATNIVPVPMQESATVVRNLFGGTVDFMASSSPSPQFTMTLTEVPQEACPLLSTTDFAGMARQVSINGTNIKAIDAPVTAETVSNAAAACTQPFNNIIAFTHEIINVADITTVDPNSGRPRENPYYIPTVGHPVASPSVSCVGGSSWNGSFCGCPPSSEWNGRICEAYGSRPGVCPMGQGWDGQACVPHETPNSGGVYQGGRYVPNVGYSSDRVQQTQPSADCNEHNTLTPGNYDTKTCQTCSVGVWNGFRCVAP